MFATLNRISFDGFRIFFLAAALYGGLTGLIWGSWLALVGQGVFWDLPGGEVLPSQWHAHEMIFGYAAAAVGGFFLTAVPSWTGTEAARRGFVLTVAGLWLLGRAAIWFSAALPPALVMALDQLFIPVLAAKVLAQLLKRPKLPNIAFLVLLTALWGANLLVHLEWMGITQSLDTGLRMGLMALCAMIAVLGGRVTPGFTRNAMKRDGVDVAQLAASPDWMNKAVLVLALLLPWAVTISPVFPEFSGALALALAMLQLLRQRHWGALWTRRQPILWTLHLGMGFLALGLANWGLAQFGIGTELAALHLLGIGGVGGMTVAVMSRASLGHTGRALVASRPMVAAYALLPLTALLRSFADSHALMLITAGLWTGAFSCLFLGIWPALSSPRAERTAG